MISGFAGITGGGEGGALDGVVCGRARVADGDVGLGGGVGTGLAAALGVELDGGVGGFAACAPGIDPAPKPELIGGGVADEADVAVPPEVTIADVAGRAA